jgi:hypothetical protein
MVHRISVLAPLCYSSSGARRRRVPFSRPAANAFELLCAGAGSLVSFARAVAATAQSCQLLLES